MRMFEIMNQLRHIEVDEEYGSAQGYTVDSNAEQLVNWLEKHHIRDDELVIGIRRKYSVIGFLNNINVDEEHQGQGHGSSILEEFISEASDNGAEAILLLSDTGESQREGFDLQSWYSGYGFSTIRTVSSGHLMILEL